MTGNEWIEVTLAGNVRARLHVHLIASVVQRGLTNQPYISMADGSNFPVLENYETVVEMLCRKEEKAATLPLRTQTRR